MKRTIIFLSLLACLGALVSCTDSGVDVAQTAAAVARRGQQYIEPRNYPGSVYTQALAELYRTTGDEEYLSRASAILDRFQSGQWEGYGSFISYTVGGAAAPEMVWYGFDKYSDMAMAAADSMFTSQPRNADGVMLPPWENAIRNNGIFMDPVFAVTPYLLYAGLAGQNKAGQNQNWVDYAAWMTLKTFEDLYDPTTGLAHQARGVRWMAEGQYTDDCWSRGNGWGSMALGALMRDLPKDNKYYQDVCALARRYFKAVLKYQDENGLWHQEMTWPESFVEISGTALLLYGIGSGIEAGVLPESYRAAFEKGIAGLLTYIDGNGNVANTCSGCLAYGDGTKQAYADHPYFCNEVHAFGPTLLALGQALRLGVKKVDTVLGGAVEGVIPECAARCYESRKADIAWENDRAAFRIYSQQVKQKVSSGVDYWAKKVDWPILDKWYAKDAAGGSYHEDEGEGCDFYAVGKNRGIGGIGIWAEDRLIVPEPYISYNIDYSTPDSLCFTVVYPTLAIPSDSVVLTEKISMQLRSCWYKAEISAKTVSGSPVTLAAGITTFGAPQISRSEENCSVWITEPIASVGEQLGSAIIASRDSFKGFACFGNDELVLMDIPADGIAGFYAGAAWSRDSRISPFTRWDKINSGATFENITESLIAVF